MHCWSVSPSVQAWISRRRTFVLRSVWKHRSSAIRLAFSHLVQCEMALNPVHTASDTQRDITFIFNGEQVTSGNKSDIDHWWRNVGMSSDAGQGTKVMQIKLKITKIKSIYIFSKVFKYKIQNSILYFKYMYSKYCPPLTVTLERQQ